MPDPISTGAAILGGAGIGAAADLLGGLVGRDENRRATDRSIEAQREFAKHGIQWRVEDAKAAGLHPLYALGASTSGPSVSVMDDPLGRSISSAGQNVSRAVAATSTSSERAMRELQLEIAKFQAQKSGFEAAQARIEAERSLRPSTPGFPAVESNAIIPGQGDTELAGGFQVTPRNVTSRDWRRSDTSALSSPLWDLAETRPGTYTPFFYGGQPSEQFENPLAALWTISEAMARDPNWMRNSGFPYGVTINEFMDWREEVTKNFLDAVDEAKGKFRSAQEAQAFSDKLRRRYLMKGRGRNRARSEQ